MPDHPLTAIRSAAPVVAGQRVGDILITAVRPSRYPGRDTVTFEMPDGVRSCGLVRA